MHKKSRDNKINIMDSKEKKAGSESGLRTRGFRTAGHDWIASFGEEGVFLSQTTFLASFVELYFPEGLITGGPEIPLDGQRIGAPPPTAVGLADRRRNGKRIASIYGVDGRQLGSRGLD